MSNSKIQWTEQTPNPIVGCSKTSPGCENCYAIKMAWRLMHIPNEAIRNKYAGTVEKTKGGKLNWTGKINFDGQAMRKVIANRRPTIHFVNSMGDLFHPSVPFHQIDVVFAAFAIGHWHTYQVLTKHPDRMLQWFNYKDHSWANEGMRGTERIRYQCYHFYGINVAADAFKWPLPNVHLGVSVENQRETWRIEYLLQIPASVRFLSCEPLLSKIDLTPYFFNWLEKCPKHGVVRSVPVGFGDEYEYSVCPECNEITEHITEDIDWVIAGGESGHCARPMHPAWIRDILDQCKNASVPFFFKQWGEFTPYAPVADPKPHVWIHETGAVCDIEEPGPAQLELHPGEWLGMWKVGKKQAGALLDGEKYQEQPRTVKELNPDGLPF